MAKLEDDNDVQATRCARAETMAELSEFDESQLTGGDEDADPDVLEVENKMRQLMSQVSLFLSDKGLLVWLGILVQLPNRIRSDVRLWHGRTA